MSRHYQNKKEELKRMKQGPGMVAGKGIVITATAAKAVDAGSSILLLPLRVLQRVLLGKLPEKATSGSFQETQKVKRRGGLLTFWRRQPEVVVQEVVEEDVDELDPEVEANQRLRDELEEELRAKIQAQGAAACHCLGERLRLAVDDRVAVRVLRPVGGHWREAAGRQEQRE